MFSPKLKHQIAESIEKILLRTEHPELPKDKIQFLLHVDGIEIWSWANIRNNNPVKMNIPDLLKKNITKI